MSDLLRGKPADSQSLFPRQCLLDSYSMNDCPNCGGNLISTTPSGAEQLVCNLENEGGLQEKLDILSILREEGYLQAFPEERIGLAFLSFCGEGDIEACVDLLKSTDSDVLRYQDGLGTMCSGLHVAVQKQRVDVAWLLLFLASNLDISQFPAMVLEAAEGMELKRDEDAKEDIRSLKNADGVTAEQQAAGIGGVWSEWLQVGLLSASNS